METHSNQLCHKRLINLVLWHVNFEASIHQNRYQFVLDTPIRFDTSSIHIEMAGTFCGMWSPCLHYARDTHMIVHFFNIWLFIFFSRTLVTFPITHYFTFNAYYQFSRFSCKLLNLHHFQRRNAGLPLV
jgi:hypothetical protein